jgi:hypothetical protein
MVNIIKRKQQDIKKALEKMMEMEDDRTLTYTAP